MRFWRRWPLTLLLAAATVLLSLVGYYAQQPWSEAPHLLDWVVNTTSLFKISWAWKGSTAAPWTLEVARCTGAAFTLSALAKVWMKFFGEQMTRLRLSWTSNHVIVCGLGQKGLQLAAEFQRHGQHRVVVLDRDPEEDDALWCRRQKMLLQSGDATKDYALEAVRVERARYLFAVCRDDRTNLEVVMAALARFQHHGRDALTCYVHLQDLPLRLLLEQHELMRTGPKGFQLSFFNSFENTARALLTRHALEGTARKRVHLVLVGWSSLADALITQTARVAHYANPELTRISLVDRSAAENVENVLARQPGIRSCSELIPVPIAVEDPRFIQLDFLPAPEDEQTIVVLCLDREEVNVSMALRLSQQNRPGLKILAWVPERQGLARLLAAVESELARRNIQVFGAIEEVCGWETLRTEEHDSRAKAFAEFYRSKYGGPTWGELDEDLRNSNRAAADHIPIKLRAIRCRRVPKKEAAPFSFTAAEVELLAQMEHRRWCADRLLSGWVPAEQTDRARKQHEDLRPWESLTEAVRNKNREQVEDLPGILAATGEAMQRL